LKLSRISIELTVVAFEATMLGRAVQ